MASRYGLCSRRAALLMICVFRDMHDMIRHRRLTAEINAFYKERQAAWAVMREEKRVAKMRQKKCASMQVDQFLGLRTCTVVRSVQY